MANYASLLATIAANIYTNGNQEVTAAMVKTAMNEVVNTLGAGYQFMGVAHPSDTPSGYADLRAFWLASEAGTYTNFGGLVLNDGEVAILKYNGSWSKEVTGAATAAQLTELGQKMDGTSINCDEGILLNPLDGLPIANSDLCVSDYVPVTTNDIVTTHPGFTSENANAYLLGYDSSKQYISGQYWAIARAQDIPERTITIANSNVRYVRMVFLRDASEAFVKVNGNKSWEYHRAEMGVFEYDIANIGGEKTLYRAGQYTGWRSGYVHDGTGVQTSSTANKCTGFIEIDGYNAVDVLMNYPQGVTRAGVCFYKNDGTFILGYAPRSGAPSSGLTEERTLQVPAGAKYARFSIRNDAVNIWFLVGIKQANIKLTSLQKKQRVTMEFGNLDANGQMKPYASDFFDNARTPLYYKLLSVNLPYSYKIYVYGSDYALVDTITAQANTDYELDPAKWHKIVINYTANSLPVKEIVIDLEVIEKSYNIITPKTIKTFQYLVKYKKGRGLYADGDSDYSEAYNMADDLISNTLRFYLPTNYSPTGEPVKLIYKAHGSNGYSWIDLDTWGGDSSIDYLADEGFALYDMFAGTSYYQAIINPTLTHDSSQRIANYNIPIQLAAQVAAYEWIVSHFNVDRRVYVLGKSHGGMAGIYATNKIVPTRAVALFAPLITQIGDLYQPWGNHSNECSMCLDDMCFIPPVGMTFDQMVTAVNTKASGWKDILLSNIRQQSGLNAYLNGITNIKQATLLSSLMDDDYAVVGGMDDVIRHSETPVKIWCAPDDAEVVFANGWNFINSLQNGGSNAQFREFPTGTGGHYFDSFTDANSIKDTVTTALGVQYTAPRAYIEAVNFFHQF